MLIQAFLFARIYQQSFVARRKVSVAMNLNAARVVVSAGEKSTGVLCRIGLEQLFFTSFVNSLIHP